MKYIATIIGILLLCATLAAELQIVRIPHINFDGFGFFAWYGFLSGIVLIMLGKLLGKLLKRNEDYYRD